MGLRDLQLPTTTITTPGGDFAVRGVSLSDLMILANSHGPTIALMFSKAVNGEKIDMAQAKAVIAAVAAQAPDLVAELIALASDDHSPEAIAAARKLNFQYQVEALEAIFHNTFQTEAEVKKFMERIINMLTGATGLLTQMRLSPSDLGFSVSGGK